MLITVTRLRIKSIFKLRAFMRYTRKANEQMKTSEGVKHHSLKAQNLYTYWTLTAWESKEHMLRFRNSGAHLEAMKATRQLTNDAQALSWEAEDVPKWAEAMQALHAKYKGRKIVTDSGGK